jgi:hypothetical protein
MTTVEILKTKKKIPAPDEEHIPGSIVVAELVELAAVEGAAAMSVVAAAGHNQFVDHKKQHPTVPGH